MTIPTTALSETTPAGSEQINQGDNRIREYKVQNREILEVDHVYPSTGQDATAGKHKKISLIEQANLGTGATGLPILGAQTVGGKAELVFTDEDDTDVQITTVGKINGGALGGTLSATIMGQIYPVGIVITLGVSTNPATLFGVGTWTAIAGKVIIGIDAGQTEFDTLDETGGAKTHTHTGSVDATGDSQTITTGGLGSCPTTGHGHTFTTAAGSSLPPYQIKYIWQRTS